MTQITDAKLIIETLKGSPLDAASLLRVADAVLHVDPYHFRGWYDHMPEVINPPDYDGGPEIIIPAYDEPRGPTNEEKAELFNKTLERFIRIMLREKAEAPQRDIAKSIMLASVKAAGDAAEATLEK